MIWGTCQIRTLVCFWYWSWISQHVRKFPGGRYITHICYDWVTRTHAIFSFVSRDMVTTLHQGKNGVETFIFFERCFTNYSCVFRAFSWRQSTPICKGVQWMLLCRGQALFPTPEWYISGMETTITLGRMALNLLSLVSCPFISLSDIAVLWRTLLSRRYTMLTRWQS